LDTSSIGTQAAGFDPAKFGFGPGLDPSRLGLTDPSKLGLVDTGVAPPGGFDGAAAGPAGGNALTAADQAGAAGRGGGMMPMSQGGGNQGNQERERKAWLPEDGDIWGVDESSSAPPVL
jgi:hypothetical protein